MAVEAFAYAKYTRFAACARMNENPELARLFQTTADVDRIEHFRKEFDFAHSPCDDLENLRSAINDKAALIQMYSEFIRQAQNAGDGSAAAVFDSVRQDEMLQVENFRHALGTIHPESHYKEPVGA